MSDFEILRKVNLVFNFFQIVLKNLLKIEFFYGIYKM